MQWTARVGTSFRSRAEPCIRLSVGGNSACNHEDGPGTVPRSLAASVRSASITSMLMQVISVVGAVMVLAAYALIQAGVWRELDAGYLALNIVGSLLLGIVAIEDRRVGFVLLEFVWAGIGVVGVVRALRARRAP